MPQQKPTQRLHKADKKADEANTIADDAKKEQQEAQDAFDKAQAGN